jgi:pteridine reductase
MQDSVVLVTGGARRIGSVISRTLHESGARIVLHCNKSRDAAEELAEELNAARPKSCDIVQADLLQAAALPRLAEDAARAFGRLDGLVNNASSFHATPMGEIQLRDWEDLMGTNLRAPLFLSQGRRAAPARLAGFHREHRGHPRRASARGFRRVHGGEGGACRSHALARARARPDVRVNGVAPGAILWPEGGQHSRPPNGIASPSRRRSSASAARRTWPAR